jgi:hypothetical protein
MQLDALYRMGLITLGSSTNIATMSTLYVLFFLTGLSSRLVSALKPMNCSIPAVPQCTSFLYLYPAPQQNLSEIAANFGVNQNSGILASPSVSTNNGYMIKKQCNCSKSILNGVLFTEASYNYTVTDASSNSSLSDISRDKYGDFVYMAAPLPTLKANSPTPVRLLCGCPIGDYATAITYLVQPFDNVTFISSNFQSKVLDIQKMNTLPSSSDVLAGQVIFIPTNLSKFI